MPKCTFPTTIKFVAAQFEMAIPLRFAVTDGHCRMPPLVGIGFFICSAIARMGTQYNTCSQKAGLSTLVWAVEDAKMTRTTRSQAQLLQ